MSALLIVAYIYHFVVAPLAKGLERDIEYTQVVTRRAQAAALSLLP